MELERARFKAFQCKLALALVLIRNKPSEMNLEEFVELMRLNFTESHQLSSTKMELLKTDLLNSQKELFYIKNKDLIDKLADDDEMTLSLSSSKSVSRGGETIKTRIQSNVEFLISIVKLKSIGNDVKLDDTSDELIVDTLISVLNQIGSVVIENDCNPGFPIESVMHGAQVFVNIFDLEWFFHLRHRLFDLVVAFIDNLVRAIVTNQDVRKCLYCGEILSIMATSDFLINSVLASIMTAIQILVNCLLGDIQDKKLDDLVQSCSQLCRCVDSIVKIRQLDNFATLSEHTRQSIQQTLNTIFINLTENYPILAIQMSNLIQLLSNQSIN